MISAVRNVSNISNPLFDTTGSTAAPVGTAPAAAEPPLGTPEPSQPRTLPTNPSGIVALSQDTRGAAEESGSAQPDGR
jgi:hypothetical protein